jgi:hypothetical protein
VLYLFGQSGTPLIFGGIISHSSSPELPSLAHVAPFSFPLGSVDALIGVSRSRI